MKSTLLLRISVAVILIMHCVPGMFNNGIYDFGKLYLDTMGFAPFGLAIAWTIKLSHLITAVLLLLNRYLKLAGWVTIFILVVGIFMVHLPDGWYVVGGGRNGVEFNFLLIFVLLAIMYPNGISFNSSKE
ncbi:DoxX family membrane protein [Flavobacterium enshiense]|uniref:DoxX family protein n=1 Tax=Flavobacterium enshiense TaxID=1341165 RepID=UPI00345D860B